MGEDSVAGRALAATLATLELLAGSRRASQLIRYLTSREGWCAHLDQIAVEVYGCRESNAVHARKTVRTQVDRTAERLDREGAPLRLTIADSTVYLVDETDLSMCTMQSTSM